MNDFKRILLEAGETKITEFNLDSTELAFLNQRQQRVVEAVVIESNAGGSMINLKEIKLTVKE